MPNLSPSQPLRVCLVGDDDAVEAAVLTSLPPPHHVRVFPMAGIVNAHNALSEQGQAAVAAALASDVVLVVWQFEQAPVINTFCYHVRSALRAPVLALYRGHHDDAVAAVAAGADEALTLPLFPALLHARAFAYRRLVAAAREAQAEPRPAPGAEVQHFGALRLDRAARRFFVGAQEVALTPREFALLSYLLENAEAACARDQILDRVWGINFDTGTNMVDVYMHFLRRKLEAYGLKNLIQTVRGFGYRLSLEGVLT